ncbi:MAG TPA: hypothetical protein VHE34_22935 [Puia sp.]|uniref:DUF6934 family protein n=1 Tax=Puia sp. TaxID=2045100 RepID=UPI002BF5A4CA|nr:hypothetical protein [Puia sp.]HVU98105.1 hypothetical protein [Puia sp.]
MLPERYEYRRARGYREYQFFSEGPKGKIRKLVIYSYLATEDGHAYYNLGFGDYDAVANELNDFAISNNLDRDKVLATVAATAEEFTRHYPGSRIVVKESTPARTRLYQMKIALHYSMIAEIFDIQCQTATGKSVPFRKGENYEGFIFERKA